jgi:biopolymer transport protein ExbB
MMHGSILFPLSRRTRAAILVLGLGLSLGPALGGPGRVHAQAPLLEGSVANPVQVEAVPPGGSADSLLSGLAGGEIPTRNMLQVVKDGGPLMIPIGICSFILFVFVFERSISLRRGRVIPGPFVKRFLEQIREKQLDREQALELCETNGSPVAEVFAAAVKKWGRPSVEVEQAIIDAGERVTNGLRRYLRLFNGITTISPLLGLLGTVLGMIRAFNAIVAAGAMGRPELLAAGISQALLTTAAGLSVAIPALIAYLYFVSRVDRLIVEIDSLGQELVGLISADAWQNGQDSKSKSRSKAA